MDKIIKTYEKHLNKIDEVLFKSVSELGNLREPIEYFLSSGGKRIRPLLGIIINLMFSGNPDMIINKCASVELIHTASLIHDDIIDQSEKRRGVETVHIKFGMNKAILAGDVLVVKALELMYPYSVEFKLFADTCYRMAQGEVKTDYYENIKGKTAALFELIAGCAVFPLNLEKNQLNNIKKFGLVFGLIFQMRDDFIDGKCKPDYIEFLKTARELLNSFPENKHQKALTELLDFSAIREY